MNAATSDVSGILETLARGENLDAERAAEGFRLLVAGELTPGQAGAFLMGLRAKGETPEELTAGVLASLAEARLIKGITGASIDTCGTGGDSKRTFNCSTAVALYLAALGHQVVKHGNRAVSSSCGSADIVEMLGLPLATEPGDVPGELDRRRFVFLFAPLYHPAFARIAPIRKELGIRTLFNFMGPLLNPARPSHQLLGVANPAMVRLMAETLRRTGCKRAAVVHGAGGYDELTPFGRASVVWVSEDGLEEGTIDPAEFGIPAHRPEDVTVAGKEDALSVMREILAGSGPQAMRDMLVLNLGLALHLLEETPLAESVDKARAAVDAGVARKVAHA